MSSDKLRQWAAKLHMLAALLMNSLPLKPLKPAEKAVRAVDGVVLLA